MPNVSLSKGLWCAGTLSATLLVTPFVLNGIGRSVESVETVAAGQQQKANVDVLEQIAKSQVVYLAETHDDPADHTAQLEIIEALARQGAVAIGLEMFQRPFQPVLDAYLAGEITEQKFIADSEYETRWGFDWELYAPIVRYAKANQIPLMALNTPAEVTRKVATSGLESLSGNELAYIPTIADIDLSNEDYRRSLQAIFGAHGGAGHSMDFENFFAAQVLWDETMAEQVAQQLAAQPERQVVVLAGEGHVLYNYGIPSRVKRRMPEVKQSSVRLVDSDNNEEGATDFVWVTGES